MNQYNLYAVPQYSTVRSELEVFSSDNINDIVNELKFDKGYHELFII